MSDRISQGTRELQKIQQGSCSPNGFRGLGKISLWRMQTLNQSCYAKLSTRARGTARVLN